MTIGIGLNRDAKEAAVRRLLNNGAVLHLLTAPLSYTDGLAQLEQVEISETAYEPVSVTGSDFDVVHDDANEEATLTNNTDFSFGIAEQNWDETISDAAISAGDEILRLETSVVDEHEVFEAERVEVPMETLEYTLG